MAGDSDDRNRDEGTKRSVKMPTLPTPPGAAPAGKPAVPPADRAAGEPVSTPAGSAPPLPPEDATSTRTEVRHDLLAGAGADAASEAGTMRRAGVGSSVRLQRVQPPGRSGSVALDRAQFLLGRLESSDIRLYTATASREHARVANRGGSWFLQPLRSPVIVNGVAVKEEIKLVHKMHLRLGEDELVFIDDSVAESPEVAAADAASGPGRLLVVLAVLAGVGGIVLWLVLSG
jgi:hypothetical protein